MPPSIALCIWAVLLAILLYADPARDRNTSAALWVPAIWMFILGSRLPSQWIGGQFGMAAEALEDGNPLDRLISSALIALAIGILVSRSFKWDAFIARNLTLMVFLSFALLSVFWSDFPLVTAKRWFRDIGNYMMVLVVLSDPSPFEAVRSVLRRFSYLMISLSILLVKYFPEISRTWDVWTGVPTFTGAATSKNMLGLACAVSGLFFFWDTVTRWSSRKERKQKEIILVNVGFTAMTVWLMDKSESATSRLCLIIGCLVIVAVHSKMFRRRPGLLKVLIPASFVVYVILAVGFDLNAHLAGAVGRDPTLTDRTKIWSFLLSMQEKPILGAGYESFWLGPRLDRIWQDSGLGKINEAHNGYLEVYLNLGFVGLGLLCGFLIASYVTISRRLKPFSSMASLTLAFWTVLLFYNITEAGFRSGILWVAFLLGAVVVPVRIPKRAPQKAVFGQPQPVREVASPHYSGLESRWRTS